jgi:hypothetical protein
MNIAVILSHCNIEHGIISSVSSEARASLNYAWMLASKGHIVDLSGTPGILLSGEVLYGVNLGRRPIIYDICICSGNIRREHIPDADLYIEFSFNPIFVRNSWRLNKKKNVKACAVFKDCAHLYSEDPSNDTILEYPTFPLPIPGNLDYDPADCFERKEIVWTTKHIYGYDNPRAGNSLNIKQIPVLLNIVFSKYISHNYVFNSFFDALNVMKGFINKGLNHGVLYDELFDVLSRCKISINSYFIGSVLESVACGCLPLIWEFEFKDCPISNWPFVKEARELGCILKPSDGAKVIGEIIHRLMEDKEYYTKVLQCYKESMYDYTFDGSYEAFKQLIKE